MRDVKIVKVFVVLSAGIIALESMCLPSVYAEPTEEQGYVADAATLLEYMSVCAQKAYDGIYSEVYPGPEFCRSDLCWNSSSITGSTANLVQALQMTCIGFNLSFETSFGDIRFRCRYQKDQTICFAYRCEEKEPAGCKQKWRLERWRAGNATTGLMKCVDVENRDHCQLFESPATPVCPAGCQ